MRISHRVAGPQYERKGLRKPVLNVPSASSSGGLDPKGELRCGSLGGEKGGACVTDSIRLTRGNRIVLPDEAPDG